jgi:hypothetical protein
MKWPKRVILVFVLLVPSRGYNNAVKDRWNGNGLIGGNGWCFTWNCPHCEPLLPINPLQANFRSTRPRLLKSSALPGKTTNVWVVLLGYLMSLESGFLIMRTKEVRILFILVFVLLVPFRGYNNAVKIQRRGLLKRSRISHPPGFVVFSTFVATSFPMRSADRRSLFRIAHGIDL